MAHKGDHDRVVMASLHPDGTPNQTDDFTYIGNKDFAKAAAVEQRKQQAVSATDVELRGVSNAGSTDGDSKPDAAVQKLVDAHESAAKAAESEAKADVDKRFEDVAPRRETEARRDTGVETTSANSRR